MNALRQESEKNQTEARSKRPDVGIIGPRGERFVLGAQQCSCNLKGTGMKTGLLKILTALAFAGSSLSALAHPCERDLGHKHCDQGPGGDEGDSVVYTAQLSGAFVFNTLGDDEHIVAVTPNNRESSLHSDKSLDISRPGLPADCEGIGDQETFDACMTWHHVFNTCPLLLAPDSVDGVIVAANDWSIQSPGGVYVQFEDMLLQGAKISMNLVGDKSVNTDPFLPPVGEPSVFILDSFATWGRSLPGGGPGLGCEPFENRPLGYFYTDEHGDMQFRGTFITLVITATEPSP